MKAPDLEKERSERKLTQADFLETYNQDLPETFPRASNDTLKIFKTTFPAIFKEQDTWSLDQHRKKFMDWLPQHIKSNSR